MLKFQLNEIYSPTPTPHLKQKCPGFHSVQSFLKGFSRDHWFVYVLHSVPLALRPPDLQSTITSLANCFYFTSCIFYKLQQVYHAFCNARQKQVALFCPAQHHHPTLFYFARLNIIQNCSISIDTVIILSAMPENYVISNLFVTFPKFLRLTGKSKK